jgi:hypothetical protein
MMDEIAQTIIPKKEFRSKAAKARRAQKKAAKKSSKEGKPPTSSRPKDSKGGVAKQSHDANSKKNRKDDNNNQKKNYLDKIGGAAGLAGLAAMGITAAAAVTMAGEAAAAAVACEDAEIKVTSIGPTDIRPDWLPDWEWIQKLVPKPSTVDVAYTVNTSYTPLEGKDSFSFSGTGTELDGGDGKKVIKFLGGNVIRIKCLSKDCSNVTATTGTADVNCADFSDRMNKEISDVATDITSTLGRSIKGLWDGVTGNLPIIILLCLILFVFFYIVPLFKK